MAIKRLISDEEQTILTNRDKLKKRIKTELEKPTPDLEKCIRILARYVFGEEDGQ